MNQELLKIIKKYRNMFSFGPNPVAESATNQLVAIEMACAELKINHKDYDSYEVINRSDNDGRYLLVRLSNGVESKKYYYSS